MDGAMTSNGPTPTPNPDGVVVRVDQKTRKVMTICICVIVGLLVLAVIGGQMARAHPQPPEQAWIFSIATIAFGVLGILRVNRSHVVLYEDGIEVVLFPWRPRRLTRLEIASRFFHPAGWRRAAYHVLVTQNGERVKLPPYLQNNAALRTWLKSVKLLSRADPNRLTTWP
jgi:hypothetical protein